MTYDYDERSNRLMPQDVHHLLPGSGMQ